MTKFLTFITFGAVFYIIRHFEVFLGVNRFVKEGGVDLSTPFLQLILTRNMMHGV
jgi:hypothetical protein